MKTNIKSFSQGFSDFLKSLEKIGNVTDGIIGISSGFPELDNLTKGFHKGEVTFIAENEKSLPYYSLFYKTVIMNTAKTFLNSGSERILWLNDNKSFRFYGEFLKHANLINQLNIDEINIAKIRKKLDVIKKLPIDVINQYYINSSEIEEELKRNKNIRIIFIDDLNMIEPPIKGNFYEEVTLLSLLDIACRYGVSIVIKESVYVCKYDDFSPTQLFNELRASNYVNSVIFVDNPSKYEGDVDFKAEWAEKIQIKVAESSFFTGDVKLSVDKLLII